MRAFVGGVRFQLWQLRGDIDQWQTFVIVPLFTIIFGGLVESTGRADLLPNAVLAAALSCLWLNCVQHGGNMIEAERWEGTFEPLESTKAPLTRVLLGRISAVVAVAALVFPEAWLVALVVFGHPIAVPHPGLFLAALALTLLGLGAAAGLIAGLFVLSRAAFVLQNAVVYPIFLLGGVLVPIALLPEWLHPVTRVIFLSWGSDLLRATLSSAPVHNAGGLLAGLAASAVGTLVLGRMALRAVLNRARTHGTLSLV